LALSWPMDLGRPNGRLRQVGGDRLDNPEKLAQRSPDHFSIVVSMGIESWRFCRVFDRVLKKLDAIEQQRYLSQLRFHMSSTEKNLADAGLRLVNLEGQRFDDGMAVVAVNSNDFEASENLFVEQMLDPIVMNADGLVRMGRVILGRVPPCVNT